MTSPSEGGGEDGETHLHAVATAGVQLGGGDGHPVLQDGRGGQDEEGKLLL